MVTLAEKINVLIRGGYKQTELATVIECGQSMISMMRAGYTPKNKRLEQKITLLYNHELKGVK